MDSARDEVQARSTAGGPRTGGVLRQANVGVRARASCSRLTTVDEVAASGASGGCRIPATGVGATRGTLPRSANPPEESTMQNGRFSPCAGADAACRAIGQRPHDSGDLAAAICSESQRTRQATGTSMGATWHQRIAGSTSPRHNGRMIAASRARAESRIGQASPTRIRLSVRPAQKRSMRTRARRAYSALAPAMLWRTLPQLPIAQMAGRAHDTRGPRRL